MKMYKSAEGYEISPLKLSLYKTAYSVRDKTYVGIERIIECATGDTYLECTMAGKGDDVRYMFKTEELERFCL